MVFVDYAKDHAFHQLNDSERDFNHDSVDLNGSNEEDKIATTSKKVKTYRNEEDNNSREMDDDDNKKKKTTTIMIRIQKRNRYYLENGSSR